MTALGHLRLTSMVASQNFDGLASLVERTMRLYRWMKDEGVFGGLFFEFLCGFPDCAIRPMVMTR